MTGMIRMELNLRSEWEKAFIDMAEVGDDAMIDNADAISHSWDEEEWEWCKGADNDEFPT